MQDWLAVVDSLPEASYNRALFQVFRGLAPHDATWIEGLRLDRFPFTTRTWSRRVQRGSFLGRHARAIGGFGGGSARCPAHCICARF